MLLRVSIQSLEDHKRECRCLLLSSSFPIRRVDWEFRAKYSQSEWSSSPPWWRVRRRYDEMFGLVRMRGSHWKTLTGIMVWFQRCLIFILAEILIQIGVQRLIVMILLWWMIHCVRMLDFLFGSFQANVDSLAHAFFNGNETYDAISVCLCFLGGKSYAFESCCSLVDGIINCEATLKATSRWETWFSAALGCFPISLLFLVVFSLTVASALKCLFYRLDKRFELQ